MADLNEFPLVLAIREDGSVDSVVDSFERNIGAATQRAAAGFEGIRRSVAALEQQAARRIADPLGIRAALQALPNTSLQKLVADVGSSEAALGQQRQREATARIASVGREFEAAMSSIRAQQAARTAGFAQAEREGQRLIGLDNQRAAELAKLIVAPRQVSFGFDATGIEAAAQAARVQASQLAGLAAAAERSRDRMAAATLTDRAYADGARDAADAARLEAQRLTELAATQARVAAQRVAPRVDQRSGVQRLVDGDGSIDRAALSAATLDQVLGRVADRTAGIATNIERARIEQEKAALAAQTQADAAARQLADATRLVAGPSQQPSTLFYDPKGAAQAAQAARVQATALDDLARTATQVAAATNTATAADRAFALTARDAAAAAALEATRLEQVAATQGRVAAASVAAGNQIAAAGDLVTNSVRGQRFATIQASQQFQDFFIQIQGGQSPLIAFSQQASQLAFVMAGAGGAAGKFANFIAGPWGTLIFVGLSALSLLTAGLFDNKKASDQAEDAAKKFADRQGDLKNFIDATTGALTQQNKTLVLNAILTRQKAIDENAKTAKDQSRAAFEAAKNARIGAPVQSLTAREGVVRSPLDPDVQAAIRAAGGDVDKLATAIGNLARTKRPDLRALATDITTQAGTAIDAARATKDLRLEISALGGDRDASFNSLSQVSGLIALGSATDQYSRKIAQLTIKRGELETAVTRGDFKSKGGRERAAAEAAAIDKQIAAQQKLKSESERAGRNGTADANRRAGQRRQELFADAAAIGDGTDAIKAANSTYAAEITRLKNQLREGLISEDAARDAAVRARQVRNAATEAAQGAKTLDAALQQIGQEFDGDSRFVNRIEKAQAAVAEALKRIDPVTGTAQIGENEYDREDLLTQQVQLRQALLRPISDATRQLGEQAEIDAAILAGREDEAEFLRAKFQILQQYGDLTAAERADLERLLAPLRGLIAAEQDRNVEIERRGQLINAQVAAARRVQDALTDFIEKPFAKGSLASLAGSIADSRRREIAEQLSIKLFGDMGSDVYRALTRNNQPTEKAASALQQSARDLTAAAGLLGRGANDNPSIQQAATTPTAFGLNPGLTGGPAFTDPVTGDIVVTANPRDTSISVGLERFATGFDKMADTEQRKIRTQQAATIALSFAAQAIGGKTGRVIDAGLNYLQYRDAGRTIAKELGGPLGKSVGGALEGLGIGQAVGSVYDLLGVRGASKGAQIGGTIGGLTGNPLIAAGASVIGGLIGAAFFKPKFGTASITGSASGGSFATGGNGAAERSGAGTLAQAVQNGVTSIADQLGGILGDYRVSIGTFDGKYRVSTTGFTGSLDSKKAKGQGLNDFGTDGQEAAIRFAIADAIRDGAVQGLRAGTQRLISLGTDLDRQLQKALSFEGVFRELKALRDPIGAATDEIDKQLAALRKVFDEASATSEERAQLEELYTLKRADAVKQAQEQVSGQLRALLDDLRFKGDSGLSLRTREANALTAFNPFVAQIAAGQRVDQAGFTEAARALLDITRQIGGSTQSYFDRLAQITDLTGRAVANSGASNVIPLTQAVQQKAQDVYASLQPTRPASPALSFDPTALSTATQMGEAVRFALAERVPTSAIGAAPILDQRETVAALVDQTQQLTARLDLVVRMIGDTNRSIATLTDRVASSGGGGSGLSQPFALRNA